MRPTSPRQSARMRRRAVALPEDRHCLAALHGEGDAVEDDLLAECEVDVLDDDRGPGVVPGLGLAVLPLERRRHPLPARDLGHSDQADDDGRQERRRDEAPGLAAVDQVVHDHVVDDEVLDVLEDVEESAHARDGSGGVPDQGRDRGRGHVREDGPVERGLHGESQLFVHGGLGQPAEGDDQQQDVLAPDEDPAALGDRAPARAELGREQHGEDHEVETDLRLDKDHEEHGQRGGQDQSRVHERLLHAHDLVPQAETYQLLTLRLGFLGRGEVAVTDGERHRLARLDGDAHLVAARAQALGRLHGAA